MSESLANECHEFRHLTFVVDVTTRAVATFRASEAGGDSPAASRWHGIRIPTGSEPFEYRGERDMKSVVGIFDTRAHAERAAEALAAQGIAQDRITVLSPATPAPAAEQVPMTESEPPGIGRALGAVVGGATGAASGIQAAAVASVLIPGVGPVFILGALGALLLGIGGAAIGGALDESLREGLPRDEVPIYEEALRSGRSVVVALVEPGEQEEVARNVLVQAGAESLDAARERWWVGLRDAREVEDDAVEYRRGFEAALSMRRPGAPWGEVVDELKTRYPEVDDHEGFRRGYERGRAYSQARTPGRAA